MNNKKKVLPFFLFADVGESMLVGLSEVWVEDARWKQLSASLACLLLPTVAFFCY